MNRTENREEFRNINFDWQALTDPQFWGRARRFENCTFRGAYLGSSSRTTGFVRLDLSHVIFVNCDFRNCYFNGVKKLTVRNFQNPKNIATTHNLSGKILDYFKNTACSYDESLRSFYRQPGVTNRRVTAPISQTITDYFSKTK